MSKYSPSSRKVVGRGGTCCLRAWRIEDSAVGHV